VYNTAHFHGPNSGAVLQGRDNLTQAIGGAGASLEEIGRFLEHVREVLPALDLPLAVAEEVADDVAAIEPALARKKTGMVMGGVVALWDKVGGKIMEKIGEHAGETAWIWLAAQGPMVVEGAKHLLHAGS
jgi:hypothetical protein